jgi:DNA (cytosine-5)-methyltransferase 3A
MGEKWEKVLSKAIGVNGIHINSALVSAQNRKRIYWTNIGMQPSGLFGDLESIIQQPKDKCILLKDILETDVDEKYFLSEKMIAGFEKHKERHNDKGTGFGYIPKTETDKGNSLRANSALAPTDNMIIVHSTFGRTSTNGNGGNGHLSKDGDKTYCLDAANSMAVEIVAQRGRGENNEQQLEARKDGKTNCLTSVQKDNLIRQLNPSTESGGNQPYQQNRVYDVNGISPALNTDGRSHAVDITSGIRRLTPIECERLQTVADNYTAHVSDSQRYKMLGNGWTIDVIAHIFSYLPKEIINNI